MTEPVMLSDLSRLERRRRPEMPVARRVRDYDLYVAIALSLVSVATSMIPLGSLFSNAVHFLVGLLMFLVIPGYVATTGLFPGASSLLGIERWGLVMVLSAVLYVITGMLLSWMHIPFDQSALASTIAIWTITWAGITALRRRSAGKEGNYRFRVPRGIGALGALALTVSALLIVYAVHVRNEGLIAISLSITAPSGSAVGYPFELDRNAKAPYMLNLNNPTTSTVPYRVDEVREGVVVASWTWTVGPNRDEKKEVFLPTESLGKQWVTWSATAISKPVSKLTVRLWYTVI